MHIYDAVGNYISKMNLYCLDDAAAATQLVRSRTRTRTRNRTRTL